MKKLLFSLLFTATTFSSFAQVSDFFDNLSTKASDLIGRDLSGFGIRTGINISNISSTNNYLDSNVKAGFNLGVFYDYEIKDNIFIQPGVSYTTRGYKYSEDLYSEKLAMHYIQIPVVASYRYAINDTHKVSAHFGPTFALALAGRYVETWNGERETSRLRDFDYNRAEIGVNFGVTYYYDNKYLFSMSWDRALSNLYKNDFFDYKLKNRNASISVGYLF